MSNSQFLLFLIVFGSYTTFVVDFRLSFERFKTNYILYIYIKNRNIFVVGQVFLISSDKMSDRKSQKSTIAISIGV